MYHLRQTDTLHIYMTLYTCLLYICTILFFVAVFLLAIEMITPEQLPHYHGHIRRHHDHDFDKKRDVFRQSLHCHVCTEKLQV